MSRDELIALVQKIMACAGTETEVDELISIFTENVPHPAASDLIYYPAEAGISAEEIVNEALSYQPVEPLSRGVT